MKMSTATCNITSITQSKSNDFLTSRFAPYYTSQRTLHRSHKHSFYQLLLFTKGTGTHIIDFVSFSIKPGQVYFLLPGQTHRWNFDEHLDGYVINFSASFFQSFLLKPDYLEQFAYFTGAANSVIGLSDAAEHEVRLIFEGVLNEFEKGEMLGLDFIKALMLQLFIILARLGLKAPPTQFSAYNRTLINRFLKLIEANVGQLKLPRDYAKLLFVTPNHLNSLCNDILGKSTGEIIRDRLILEAKRMIVNPELPISEIAFRLNFTDNSYFSKFFKKYTGMTPEEFRNATHHLSMPTNDYEPSHREILPAPGVFTAPL